MVARLFWYTADLISANTPTALHKEIGLSLDSVSQYPTSDTDY
jgi:hypothetical protein